MELLKPTLSGILGFAGIVVVVLSGPRLFDPGEIRQQAAASTDGAAFVRVEIQG